MDPRRESTGALGSAAGRRSSSASGKVREGTLIVEIHSAEQLRDVQTLGTMTPYVSATVHPMGEEKRTLCVNSVSFDETWVWTPDHSGAITHLAGVLDLSLFAPISQFICPLAPCAGAVGAAIWEIFERDGDLQHFHSCFLSSTKTNAPLAVL